MVCRIGSVIVLCLAVLPLVSACGLGDQFGGSNEIVCVEMARRKVPIEQRTEVGFSGRDVLDFAVGSFSTPFSLSVPVEDYSGLRVVPSGGESTLHVEIASSAREATHVTIARQKDSDTFEDAGCEDALEIEASVHLRSDDGAFDDTIPVVLRADDPALASTTFEVEAGGMNGTFDLIEDDELVDIYLVNPPANWVLERTEMTLRVVPGHISGTLFAWFGGESPADREHTALVGLWTSSDFSECYTEDFGGVLDEGYAVSRLRERLSEGARLAVTFVDQSGTDLSLDATFEPPARVCPRDALSYFETNLTLTRPETGEVFAVLPMEGRVTYTSDGHFTGVFFEHLREGAELAEAFGVETEGEDPVLFSLQLSKTDEDGWFGLLDVFSWSSSSPGSATCPAGMVSSPSGCAFAQAQVVEVE